MNQTIQEIIVQYLHSYNTGLSMSNCYIYDWEYEFAGFAGRYSIIFHSVNIDIKDYLAQQRPIKGEEFPAPPTITRGN